MLSFSASSYALRVRVTARSSARTLFLTPPTTLISASGPVGGRACACNFITGSWGVSYHHGCSSLSSSMRRARSKNGALDALHQSLRACWGLHSTLLQIVNFLKLLLNPSVPEVEWNLLLFAFGIELARGHGEDEICILLVVDDFQGQATL